MATTKVQAEHIAINAISGTIIADNAVTSVHIAQNAILTQHIDDGQVGTSQLAADAVTGAKLADSSVVTANIQDDQVTGDKLTDNIQIAGTLGVTGIITANSSSSGDYVRLYGSSGTGKWDIYGNGANLRISDNESAGRVWIDTDLVLQPTYKLYLDGSNDTYISEVAANAVNFFTGGAERMRLTTTGLGIGTTSPDTLLTVKGTSHQTINIRCEDGYNATLALSDTSGNAYESYIRYKTNTNDMAFAVNGGEKMHILDTGEVGIGTAAPAEKLHIFNSAQTWNQYANIRMSTESDSYAAEIGFHRGTSNDNDRGLFLSGDGSTKHVRVLHGGNVGINTTSPSEKLDIDGTIQASVGLKVASHPVVGYASFDSGYATRLGSTGTSTLDATQIYAGGSVQATFKGGKVGIGTTSPNADLHLYATADDRPHLKLEGYKNHGTDDAPIIEFYTNDETTGGISDNTVVGNIAFYGDEKDGGTKELYAQIRGIAHDPGQGSSNKGKLQFRTQSAGDISGTMTIDESSVGINNDDPATALHVKQSGSAFIRVDCGGGTSDSGFEIYQNGTRKWEIVNDDSESDPLDIRTSGGAGGSGLRIAQTGNVGIQIGNNVPASPLHVLAGTTGNSPYVSTAITMAPSNFPARTWQIRMDDGGSAGYGMSIAAAGNRVLYLNNNNFVGINTPSPATYLHIDGDNDGGDVMGLIISNTDSGGTSDDESASMKFMNKGQNSAMIRGGKYGNYGGSTTRTGDLQFHVSSNGAGAFMECMRMIYPDDNGGPKVGIGTTSPQAVFDVTVPNAKTASAGVYMYLGKTNESSNYGALQCFQIGANSHNSRQWKFQTIEQGVSNEGTICFQESGGEVCIGGTSNANKLSVVGSFSKSSGSFRIPHPLPSLTDTKDLVHSFIEGPQADLIYRGKVDLSSGTATVNIDTAAGMTDGTFVLLCDDVQCFTTNEDNWDLVKASVSGNILTITSQNSSSTATISWLVIGERKDQHMIDTRWTDSQGKVIVEPDKA